MRSLAFVATILSTASLFADVNLEQKVSLLESRMDQVRTESIYSNRSGARFASGRPVTAGYNLSAFVDVLYWKFLEGGNDYAYKTYSEFPINGRLERFNYEWEPGYRIGASYGFSDRWDFTATYTHLKTDGDDAETPPTGGFISYMPPYRLYGNVTIDGHLKYRVFNFEMGSSYFVSRSFYLRPHFGLQGAWIHSKKLTTASDYNFYERYNQTFNGGGLRVGLDTKWFFHPQWNLVFNASGSTLYGKFKVTMKDHWSSDPIVAAPHVRADVSRLVPAAHTLVGLCWERNFAEDNNHIALTLAYESTYWWRQVQLVRLENTFTYPPYGTRVSEDLGSNGLTFDFSLFF